MGMDELMEGWMKTRQKMWAKTSFVRYQGASQPVCPWVGFALDLVWQN